MAKLKPGKKVDSFSFKVKVEQALGFRRMVPEAGASLEGAMLAAMNEIDVERDEILVVTVSRAPVQPAGSVTGEIDRNKGRSPG